MNGIVAENGKVVTDEMIADWESALERGGDLFLIEFQIDDDGAFRRHAASCYWLIVSLRTASRLKAAAIRALV